LAVLLSLAAVGLCGCSGKGPRVLTPKFDRAAAVRACRSAPVEKLPPDAPAASLSEPLQVWFRNHQIPSSSVGLGQDEVDVSLPPGCHDVADAIRRRYGQHVHVRENVVILPTSGEGAKR
jgi:hypothetical protein